MRPVCHESSPSLSLGLDVISVLVFGFLFGNTDALRQIINYGADWAAIQTSVLILLAWIVASLLITWRAFRWQA